ncbi:MAG: hypothetical protein ACK40L_13015, partial [Hydrogenophaga sp.]
MSSTVPSPAAKALPIRFWTLGWSSLVRDWRAGELRLLVLAVTLAVAALTAVGFFADRLQNGLSRDARALGADARRLGSGETVAPARRATAELDAVQAELVSSSAQLDAARAEA